MRLQHSFLTSILAAIAANHNDEAETLEDHGIEEAEGSVLFTLKDDTAELGAFILFNNAYQTQDDDGDDAPFLICSTGGAASGCAVKLDSKGPNTPANMAQVYDEFTYVDDPSDIARRIIQSIYAANNRRAHSDDELPTNVTTSKDGSKTDGRWARHGDRKHLIT